MPNVALLSYSPNPQQLVAAAAKLCYSAASVDKLLQDLTPEKSAQFVRMLSEIGHESPIEHASFTFALEGVSRALLAQITRHRIASFSVQSQRYVSKKQFEYVVPPEVADSPEALEAFERAMGFAQQNYNIIAESLQKKHEAALRKEGLDEKEARLRAEKLANEDARFVLPEACDTKMILTMNTRSLLHFFSLRCCNRAQWEIRTVAREMLRLAAEVAPILFLSGGPPCVCDACPEGKMSCGKAQQVRKEYRELTGKAGLCP